MPDELRAELPRLSPVAADEPATSDHDTDRELARLVWLATEDRLDDAERRKLPRIKRELMAGRPHELASCSAPTATT